MEIPTTQDSISPRVLRVLILDDSADDAALMLREIRKAGWAPLHQLTDNAEGMRSALRDHEWDVILSDYWMPQFDGIKAVETLQASGRDIPLIVISGAIGEESAAAVLKAGAVDFISKGNLSRLIPAIERELREAAARKELRDAERRLKESEERLRILIDGVQDYAIFLLDAEARVVSWNSGAERILGHTSPEIIGQSFEVFFTPDDLRRELPKLQIETARTTGRFEGECWHVRKDGAFILSHVINAALRDASGHVFGFTKVVRDITKQKMVEDQLKQFHEQIRELTSHLQTIREEERTDIAREIHDELGQQLTVLKFDIARLARKPPEIPEELQSQLRDVAESVDTAIQTIRKIVTELRPGLLDDLGLVAAVEWHAQEFQARTGIKCDVILPPGQIALERNRSTAVFRIFQELLTNVAKHAKATFVDVILSSEPEGLILEVRDNGSGIRDENLQKANSFGLTGMRERLRQYGGRMDISGEPDIGTTITITMPYQ